MLSPGVIEFRQVPEPSAVGAHATNRTDVKGKNVMVSGAGTIGNFVAQFAKARGARKVLITDISDYHLSIAKRCGIEGVLNVGTTSFEEGAASFFGSDGFQVGFEAAGVKASLDVLMQYVEKGGEVINEGDDRFVNNHIISGSCFYLLFHMDYRACYFLFLLKALCWILRIPTTAPLPPVVCW
jgi:threonine dehydrogenase-like Zn-dependent dehydrogenase